MCVCVTDTSKESVSVRFNAQILNQLPDEKDLPLKKSPVKFPNDAAQAVRNERNEGISERFHEVGRWLQNV